MDQARTEDPHGLGETESGQVVRALSLVCEQSRGQDPCDEAVIEGAVSEAPVAIGVLNHEAPQGLVLPAGISQVGKRRRLS